MVGRETCVDLHGHTEEGRRRRGFYRFYIWSEFQLGEIYQVYFKFIHYFRGEFTNFATGK